jgi:hypothetical protein
MDLREPLVANFVDKGDIIAGGEPFAVVVLV